MIARANRKWQTGGHAVPVKMAILILVASAMALGYIWLEIQCEALGKELKVLEAQRDALNRKCLQEESRWANMKAPGSIERALALHHLRMGWPSREQIVVLSFSGIDEVLAAAARENPVYAVRTDASRGRAPHRIAMND